jgi:hypothetical protein
MQPPSISVTCPITGAPMRHVFTQRVLERYDVGYHYSDESGLLRTEKPYWLEEAYRDAIGDTDTGIVNRNLNNSAVLDAVVSALGLQEGRLLDLAGGYGLLTRLMRDKGYDCHTTDKYCTNLFAKAFEPSEGFRADALFAFEVLEHLEDPLTFLTDAFSAWGCRTIVFSTLTFSGGIPPADWWYYSFAGGQHIGAARGTSAVRLRDARCRVAHHHGSAGRDVRAVRANEGHAPPVVRRASEKAEASAEPDLAGPPAHEGATESPRVRVVTSLPVRGASSSLQQLFHTRSGRVRRSTVRRRPDSATPSPQVSSPAQ